MAFLVAGLVGIVSIATSRAEVVLADTAVVWRLPLIALVVVVVRLGEPETVHAS